MLQERCHHQHDLKWKWCVCFIPQPLRCAFTMLCSSATTDLSLATLLKTAVFVPFFLTRNAFIKTQNRCFFASTSNETFQTRASALPQCQARVTWARKRYTSQMSFDRTMRCCGCMSVKQSSLSCPQWARSDRVIINKCTRNSKLSLVKSWNYQKRRLKLQTACMYECITFQNVSQMHTKI